MWLGASGRVVGCSVVGGSGVGIEDMHGVVAGGPEVRKVIDHKVRVRGHGKAVLLHGAFQFEDVVVLDGVLEHFC